MTTLSANDSSSTTRQLRSANQTQQQVFSELFLKHADTLRRLIRYRLDSRLLPRFDVSDVLQEVQLEAWQRFDEYLQRDPMPFLVWLRETTLQRLSRLKRDHLLIAKRSIRREENWPEHSSFLLGKALARSASVSKRLEQAEAAKRVAGALMLLSEEDRDLLLMRHVEGLTNREISLFLQVSEKATSKRYGAAILRLQKILRSS